MDGAFRATVLGEKLFATVGAAATLKVAEAVKPVPPCVELTVPVVFIFDPPVVALTVTLTEHDPPAEPIAPPVSEMLVAAAVGANVPPQVFIAFGVVSTSIPAGNVSLTATPVIPAGLPAGLVMVRVRVEVPPTATPVGEKALVIVGGAKTLKFTVLLAVPATGVCVVVTPEVVFGCDPGVELVTLKITVQLLLAGIVMPLKFSDVAPADKLLGIVPEQVPVTDPPTAVMFVSESLNVAPVRLLAFGLVSVRVTVEEPPVAIEVGLNALAMVGGPSTVKVTVPVVALLAPSSVVASVALLFLAPVVVPVTLTVRVQLVVAFRVAPDRLTVLPPGAAVAVPPQVVLKLFGVATTSPAGSVSVKPMPFNGKN